MIADISSKEGVLGFFGVGSVRFGVEVYMCANMGVGLEPFLLS